MYKKILVPLDGSTLAESALSHVRAIATGCSVPAVDLLYVVTSVLPAFYASHTIDETVYIKAEVEHEAWAKGYLDKVVKQLQKDGVAAKGVVVKGNPSENILNYAEKNGIDLIVMSTHGRSGPARWALGSVADRVVRLSAVPVMVVRSSS